MSRYLVAVVIVLLLSHSILGPATVLGPATARANPNHADIDVALAVYGGETSTAIQSRATALYETGNKLVGEMLRRAEGSKASAIPVEGLRKATVALMQLRRAASQLGILREPAQVDWDYRCNVLQGKLGQLVSAFMNTPQGQKVIQAAGVELAKQAPLRERKLKELTQMVERRRWEAAEIEWYEFYDDHHRQMTMWLGDAIHRETYRPFDIVVGHITTAMREIREKAAFELVTKQRQAQTPDFQGVLTELATATQALAASGSAEVGGQAVNGPGLVAYFGERWKDVHVRSLRCRGLDWAIRSGGTSYTAMMARTEANAAEPIVVEYEKFSGLLMQGLAGIVKADTARAAEAEIPQLYLAYTQELATIAMRTVNFQLMPVVTPALEGLAAKSPALAQQVGAYRAATDDVLRWRNRLASAAAKARSGGTPTIDARFTAGTMSDQQTNYRGLFDQGYMTATFLASAPEILPTAMERLMNQDAVAWEVVGQGGNKPAIARYKNRTYVTTRLGEALAPHVAALKTDLFISENSPPLTLAATVAARSAEAGDLALMGGKIVGMHLEGCVTRYASLPAAASTLVALGTIPPEKVEMSPTNQAAMRFDLLPTWGQHLYFFVEFPPPQVASLR